MRKRSAAFQSSTKPSRSRIFQNLAMEASDGRLLKRLRQSGFADCEAITLIAPTDRGMLGEFRASGYATFLARPVRGGTLLLTSSGAKGAAALRGRRQEAAPGPGRALLGTQYDWECSCPTRAAARGGRAPCTPSQGLRPLEP